MPAFIIILNILKATTHDLLQCSMQYSEPLELHLHPSSDRPCSWSFICVAWQWESKGWENHHSTVLAELLLNMQQMMCQDTVILEHQVFGNSQFRIHQANYLPQTGEHLLIGAWYCANLERLPTSPSLSCSPAGTLWFLV